MSAGAALAAAAEALIGVPFRLYGRDPATGLDCVGVLAVALERCGRAGRVPGGYALRMTDVGRFVAAAAALGLVEADDAAVPGDVVMLRPGPAQHHLAIAAPTGGFVHAHAGLRRVVCSDLPPAWQQIGHWRPI